MASKAFEKRFAAERAKGSKVFDFGGKKYNTKLAKTPKPTAAKKATKVKGVKAPAKGPALGMGRSEAVKSMAKAPSFSSMTNIGLNEAAPKPKGPQTRPNLTERMNPNKKNNVDIKVPTDKMRAPGRYTRPKF